VSGGTVAGLLFAGLSGLVCAQGAQEAARPQAAASDWPKGAKPAAGYYDKLGRTVPTENDVNTAVYEWFSAFDHQASPDYFVSRLASDDPAFSMRYPGAAEIKDAAGFKKWYQGVVDSIDYNSHHIVKIETWAGAYPEWNPRAGITEPGAVTGGRLQWDVPRFPVWTVKLRVRWRAPGKTSEEDADMCIDQNWGMLENTASSASAPRFKLRGLYACVVPGVTGATCTAQAASCLPEAKVEFSGE
jgi:hypothetical protein